MADVKISGLPASTLPLSGTEVLPLVQSGVTKKVASDDLTVKNIRSNATNGILQVTGPAAASTRVMTTPDANFTAARTDAGQTFTGAQTFSDTVTATKLIPTGNVTAGNGMYLPTTNTLAFSTNSVERARIASGGELLVGLTSSFALGQAQIGSVASGAAGGLAIVGNRASDAQLAGQINFSNNSATAFAGVNATRGATDAAAGRLNFLTGGVTHFRIGTAGSINFDSIGTTASAANAFLDGASANNLLRSTSSIRYKKDIETLESERADNFVLNARPVWYRSLADADRKEWGWYGLIAEEVAEIEPRLVHWAYADSDYEKVVVEAEERDEKGEVTKEARTERQLKADAKLKPDGVQYDRLAVLLLDVVKRQQKTIESLKARLDSAGL
jgi:hypothetical protein